MVYISYLIIILTNFYLIIPLNCFYIVKPVTLNEAPYDIWAHYHWIWLANEDESQDSIIKLVNDYKTYDIPVGAVNLDSSWPQNYQNFNWNQRNFSDPVKLINYLHSLDIKVLCWITSIIDNDSSNFNEAKEKGYLLNNGELVYWGHGNGAFLDYSYPEAVDWFHKQMDKILDIGIDGWKVDGTDPFIYKLIVARGHKGIITYREYADYYYRDFFYYTREKRGLSALIMARPVDSLDNILYLSYAPNDVMFSGWVGDQTGNWEGLIAALNNILRSAWRGYLNFGCDIGGYRTDDSSGKLGRTKEVFTRWFQLGTFLPLMENGGIGEHRPWVFGNDTLDIYRVFANIHTNLAPFFLSSATDCYSKNISLIQPLASRIFIDKPSTYDYLINGVLYISPFINNSTYKNLSFPGDSNSKWIYWFNHGIIYHGGNKINFFNCPFNEYPVFIASGSIIPLHVSNSYTNLGHLNSKDYVTLLITQPFINIKHKQNIHEFKSNGYSVEYFYNSNELLFELFISAHSKNRFIILLSNVYTDNSIVEIARKNNSNIFAFERIEYFKDENTFWFSKEKNGCVFQSTTLFNKFFIRISETASNGIYLKIKNLRII